MSDDDQKPSSTHEHHDHAHVHAQCSHGPLGHSHVPALPEDAEAAKGIVNRIRLAFYLNLCFAFIEVIGGVVFMSVAILADAVHDFGDALGLGLALFLQKQSQKGPTAKFTYGMKRLSLLSALLVGTLLVGGSFFVFIQALFRMREVATPVGSGMVGLAVVGIAVNAVAAWVLHKGESQNEKILTWHLLEDLLGWVATLIGGILIWAYNWVWVDTALAIGISLFVMWNGGKNLYQTLLVFLQIAPPEIDARLLKRELEALPGVGEICDFHVWSLDGERHVLTLHVRVSDAMAQELGETNSNLGSEAKENKFSELKSLIRDHIKKYGKFHTTIEIESSKETHHQDHC